MQVLFSLMGTYSTSMKNKNKNRILIGLGIILGAIIGYLANSSLLEEANDHVRTKVRQQLSDLPQSRGFSSSFRKGILHARKNIEEQAAQLETAQHQ